jgi:HPt (histidine-containing phosphotransfer) domain-containing protein
MPEERSITAAELALLDPDGAFSSRLAEDRKVLTELARGLWTVAAEARQLRLAEIEALAHRLGGAAGTFGYAAISAAAFELEARIRVGRGGPGGHSVKIDDGLTALVRALDEAFRDC